MTLTVALPYVLSALTILTMVLAGSKHRLTWAVGLTNQALWLAWIVLTGTWGLLPMNLALWVVYGRNHWKWRGPDGVVPPLRVHPPLLPQLGVYRGRLALLV